MASQGPPIDRRSFRVAIICALSHEASAVCLLFDHFWDRERGPYGRADGDTNHYITGRIGGHDVVLAVLPNMGINNAAAATASLRSSYTGLKLALLVGICGGVSRIANFDACLGDVVVSKAIVQYDYGRRYLGHFSVKSTIEDSLGRTNKDIRSLLAVFEIEPVREWLQDDASKYLEDLQEVAKKKRRKADYQYPGTNEDKLYPTTYAHRHRKGCSVCDDPNAFCESASKALCTEIGCDPAYLTGRERLEEDVPGGGFRPKVFIGRIGSGNTVMKSGADRDQIAAQHNLIAFEMEGAGAWDEVPCIVVKGICDYADGHKNKVWQDFAAATAAAVTKAILGQYTAHDEHQGLIQKNGTPSSSEEVSYSNACKTRQPCYYIPLPKNKRFTGRTTVLSALEDSFFGQEQTQRMALVGLGGVGKTQIALRFAYRIKEKRPEYSIFWVPVLSAETAERAYGDMAKKLGLQKSSEDEDVKDLVCQHLSSDKAGKWLLIIDNADEEELIFGSAEKPGLEEYLPQNENGIILLTTRSGQVANDFAQADVIYIEQMDQEEAKNLFEKSLVQKHLLRDKVATGELLAYLTFLPLAITQAAAYLNQNRAPIQTYLGLLRNAEKEDMRIFETEFRDNTRYKNSQNAVGTTWIVSFHQMQKSNHIAVDILSFISCIEPKAIPQSILPDMKPFELEGAIGALCSYSFLSRREGGDMLDMHSLVHTATQAWLEKLGRERQVFKDAVCHVAARFPTKNDVHYGLRREYRPHAMRLLNRNHGDEAVEVYQLFEKVGNSFDADRRFKEAIRCFEEVCRWKQGCHPKTDHSRLSSEHALASAYLSDRQIKDAIKILKHVVEVRKETLDEKDHSRLASEHELARAYLNDRRVKDAIKILKHVVAIEAEILVDNDLSRQLSVDLLQACFKRLEVASDDKDV
ncbi:hypothetical protein HYE67_005415 [Fusarium culmorum]|uniref:Nucleoside phosphorylase domain-containing protein n=1 Tax=Fusarium culmorum TaxID=5516 RepID=A0A7S8D709_FUSCU|nr:hypothetical protein HYE67_005415 [Fusarium culmorum]